MKLIKQDVRGNHYDTKYPINIPNTSVSILEDTRV
jgi:hypothetical protein